MKKDHIIYTYDAILRTQPWNLIMGAKPIMKLISTTTIQIIHQSLFPHPTTINSSFTFLHWTHQHLSQAPGPIFEFFNMLKYAMKSSKYYQNSLLLRRRNSYCDSSINATPVGSWSIWNPTYFNFETLPSISHILKCTNALFPVSTGHMSSSILTPWY